MYAIFETGGKQYKAQAGDRVRVEKLAGEAGDKVRLETVIAYSDGDSLQTGTPYLEGAFVNAEILGTGKGEKVIVFKYKSKKDFRKKRGHRQPYTDLLIEGFSIGGKTLGEAPDKAKPEKKVKEEKTEEAEAETEAKTEVKAETETEVEAKDEAEEAAEAVAEVQEETAPVKAEKKAATKAKKAAVEAEAETEAETKTVAEAAADGAKKETKADIMAKLDGLGVTYAKSAKKEELLALLAEAEQK